MINPLDLQNAIVDKLRDIPELVDFIGDIGEIQGYDEESQTEGTEDGAEFSMMGRAVMVSWKGAELPRTGETRGWKHAFKIALKAESIQSYYSLAQLIFDGKPDGDSYGENFLNSNISDLCPISAMEFKMPQLNPNDPQTASPESPSTSPCTSGRKPFSCWYRMLCGRLIELPNEAEYHQYAQSRDWVLTNPPSKE
jgi:hypothetical protein